MPFGQVGKTVGEMWRELEDSDRAPYQAQADADKKRYERETKSANSSAPAGQGGGRGSRRFPGCLNRRKTEK